MIMATSYLEWESVGATDQIQDWPAKIQAGFQQIEDTVYLPIDSKAAAAPYDSWPKGQSLMALTADGAAGGLWPASHAGTVISQRGPSGTTQWFTSVLGGPTSIPSIWVRTGNGNGWTAWVVVVSPGTPFATDSGFFTFDQATVPKSATVAYAKGRFTKTPVVVAQCHDRDAVVRVSGGSVDGFTILLGANGGGDTLPLNGYTINWIAVQNY